MREYVGTRTAATGLRDLHHGYIRRPLESIAGILPLAGEMTDLAVYMYLLGGHGMIRATGE